MSRMWQKCQNCWLIFFFADNKTDVNMKNLRLELCVYCHCNWNNVLVVVQERKHTLLLITEA